MTSGAGFEQIWTQSWLLQIVDVGLVLALGYLVLPLVGGDRRARWMVRGLIVLILAATASKQLKLELLSFMLEKLVVGSAVAMGVIFQSEFRRFLEQLGQGQIVPLFQPSRSTSPKKGSAIDEIVEAVKELSQNRTGALMILETSDPIDERDFKVSGVKMNAELSKELLQTIFQKTTLLHDGAVWISGDRLVSAAVILPLSEGTTLRKVGTRHRAAMGITEQIADCVCVVVSEETGSISLAERGALNRPLTSNELKKLLEAKLSPPDDEKAVAPSLGSLVRQILAQGWALVTRVFRFSLSPRSEKKK